MEQTRKKPLYIPSRVNQNNKDIVEGFGAKEVMITVVSVVVAIILFFAVNSVMNNVIVPLAVAIVVVSGTVVLVRRDNTNESLIDKLVFIYKFAFKEQKKYEYEYYDYRFPGIRKFYEIEEEE